MFALWPGDMLNFGFFKTTTFGFVGQHPAPEADHITNTNVTSKPRKKCLIKAKYFRLENLIKIDHSEGKSKILTLPNLKFREKKKYLTEFSMCKLKFE